MTIPSTTRKAGPLLGDGSQTAWPFTFKVFSTSDVAVTTANALGIETTLVLDTDYTVALNGNQNTSPGGTVTYPISGTPLATGHVLSIAGDVDYDQPLAVPTGGNFNPTTFERQLDRMVMQIQQLREQASRAIRVGVTSDADATLPAPVANNIIGWDSTANALENYPLTELATAVAFATYRYDTFTGDGVEDTFALSADPVTLGNIDVSVDGLTHVPGVDHNLVGTSLVFTTPPTNNAEILARYGQGMGTGYSGDALDIAYQPLSGTLTNVQTKLRESVSVKDFNAVGNGIASDTAAIQAMFDAVASSGVKEIYFPPGTYLITCNRTDADYTCAVVITGLKNCIVRGAKGTKFIVNATGVGPSEFGMFRVEQCEGLEFCNFEMDGSGITTTGTGGNRSRGFVLVNYDVNSKATDLAVPNKQIEFHHINVHDIGGFVGVPPRTSSLAATPYTDGLVVRDCIGANFMGQDHFVGIGYCKNVLVANNRVVNSVATTVAHVGNLFADMSAGVINAMVENNYAIGFTGGGKAETHTNAGPASNEDRPSKNVCFRNNVFEQMGDPITMIFPGAGGGGFYGIKLNGINHSAYNNTITARTTAVTTGGLYQGIQLGSTVVTPVESLHLVYGNSITGTVIGINHDTTVADTTHKYVAHIYENKLYDMALPSVTVAANDGTGIVAAKNAKVRANAIYRSKYCAILLNAVDETIVRDNVAYNCATVNHAIIAARVVFTQENSGAVLFFEFSNNTIIDDRGALAAHYGYFLWGATTFANRYIFAPGPTNTVITGVSYDKFRSEIGVSLPLDGVTTTGPRTVYTTNTPTAIAPWNAIAWRVGDRAIFLTPTVGSPKAWVCTVAGTPGTWVSEGNL